MQKQVFPWLLLLCTIIYGLAVTTNPNWLFLAFTHHSYYLISLLILMWVLVWLQWQKATAFSWQNFWVANHRGILSALLITVVIYLGVGFGYKVQSDESNLISVARSMYMDHTIFNGTMGKWLHGRYIVFNNELPIRPFVYPYLVSLVHLVAGDNHEHGFWLNLFVYFLFLIMIYNIVKKNLGQNSGIAAQILLTSQPLMVLCATSAGFDTLSCTLFTLCFYLVWKILRNPTPESIALLWLSLMVLTNTRYEQFIMIPVVFPMLWFFGKIKFQNLKPYLWLYCLSPLFALPRLWQSILLPDKYENPANTSVVGPEHFWGHFKIFLETLITFDWIVPYATVSNLISIALGFILIGLIFRQKVIKLGVERKRFLWILGISFAIINLVYFCHHAGLYHHPSHARFFLILTLGFTLMPFFFAFMIHKKHQLPLLIFSCISWGMYHQISIDKRFEDKLLLIRKDRIIKNYLRTHNLEKSLVIIDRPVQFVSEKIGATDYNWFRKNHPFIRQDILKKYYQDVLIIQDFTLSDSSPPILEANQEMPPTLMLETLWEQSFDPQKAIRISRVNFP